MFDDRVHQAGLTSHAVEIGAFDVVATAGVPHGVVAVEELVRAGLQPGAWFFSSRLVAPDGQLLIDIHSYAAHGIDQLLQTIDIEEHEVVHV